MTALHFGDQLEESGITNIVKRYDFGRPEYVEKFVMDFEINYHMYGQIEGAIRGGMCVPFHTRPEISRLSIDIDLITKLHVDEASGIMEDLTLPRRDMAMRRYVPKRPAPIPNLVTYNVEYASHFRSRDMIKVDLLCDVPLRLPTRTISGGDKVMGFEIDYPAEILTRGSLIGDKVSTLALGGIGLRTADSGLPGGVPKQVYDIASLLRASSVQDVRESMEVFRIITEFKTEIYDGGRYDVKGTLETIMSSVRGLLEFGSQVKAVRGYEVAFNAFRESYLSRSQLYKKRSRISDILLVWLYVTNLQKSLGGALSIHQAAMMTHDAISRSEKMADKTDIKVDLLKSMPRLPFSPKILRQAPAEHIFLIGKIFGDQSQ